MHRLSSDQIGHFLTAADIGFTVQDNKNYIERQSREHAKYMAEHPYKSFFRDLISGNADVKTRVNLDMINTQYERAMVGHELIADRAFSGIGITSTIAAPLVASDEDVANFHQGRLDLIRVDDTKMGNSYQDLLLSWVGYNFGVAMANNRFANRQEAARWLGMMLTDTDLSSVSKTDPFYADAQKMQGMLQQFDKIQQRIHPQPAQATP